MPDSIEVSFYDQDYPVVDLIANIVYEGPISVGGSPKVRKYPELYEEVESYATQERANVSEQQLVIGAKILSDFYRKNQSFKDFEEYIEECMAIRLEQEFGLLFMRLGDLTSYESDQGNPNVMLEDIESEYVLIGNGRTYAYDGKLYPAYYLVENTPVTFSEPEELEI